MSAENSTDAKIVLKVFLPWQDENEEKWLELMASRGWMIESAIPLVYTFSKCPSKQIIIRLDYKSSWNKDYQEYLTTFRDAGWTLQTTLGNWHYFCINPQNDVVPEIYNSNRTKAQKYRRLLVGLSPIMLCLVGPLSHALDFGSQASLSGFDIALKLFYLLAAFLFIYSFVRVWIKLIHLKINHQE